MEDTTKAIGEHIKTYIDATEDDMKFFMSYMNEVVVSKRNFLLRPGTYVKHEYFVLKGCLTAYYIDAKGGRHNVQFAIENWWIGDFDAFYNRIPSKLYIEAIEDATLLSISYSNLEYVFTERPIFERYFRILTTNAFISVRKRILSSLEKDSKERYIEFCTDYPNIEHRVPNYHIANYLGVTAESISRIRRDLKNK